MAIDLAIASIFLYVSRTFEDKTTKLIEAKKKNDEIHEQENKANHQGMKSHTLKKQRVDKQRNSKGYYKTHEKRSHHPPQHNIQQPSK